jgi:hypothetical protein
LFEREHHQRIARVLEALDADVLRARQCLFGGGTAIALRHGEYRESVDIDFIVSELDGYRQLRQALTGAAGLKAITREGVDLVASREISRAYGQSIVADLAKAIERLRQQPEKLDQCMARMRMTGVPKALLWQRIRALRP